MLQAGMAGISFVGADICGFNDYATEELCARWAAAGAWQPFARNHHADGFQEFYTWVTDRSFHTALAASALPHAYIAFVVATMQVTPVIACPHGPSMQRLERP